MGLQSTQSISRRDAESRIKDIASIILEKNYQRLAVKSSENIEPSVVIDDQSAMDLARRVHDADLACWTSKMIESVIDQPFYRHTMLDNYIVSTKE